MVCTFPSPLSHVSGDRQTEGEKHQYNQAVASIIQMALNWKPDNLLLPNVTILIEGPSITSTKYVECQELNRMIFLL